MNTPSPAPSVEDLLLSLAGWIDLNDGIDPECADELQAIDKIVRDHGALQAELTRLRATLAEKEARVEALEAENARMRTLKSRLERLRPKSAKATAGPWYHYDEIFRPQLSQRRITEIQRDRDGLTLIAWSGFDGLNSVADRAKNKNAALIVAAVNYVRAALAETGKEGG